MWTRITNERTVAAGAHIHEPPHETMYGERQYGVTDVEGTTGCSRLTPATSHRHLDRLTEPVFTTTRTLPSGSLRHTDPSTWSTPQPTSEVLTSGPDGSAASRRGSPPRHGDRLTADDVGKRRLVARTMTIMGTVTGEN